MMRKEKTACHSHSSGPPRWLMEERVEAPWLLWEEAADSILSAPSVIRSDGSVCAGNCILTLGMTFGKVHMSS